MSPRSRLAPPVAAAILLLGLAAGALSTPTPALASNGYVETAATTYTVNPTADRLDVAIDISFKNTKPPTSTTTYYFSSVYVWVEHPATHLKATADAGAPTMKRVSQSGGFDEYLVDFGRAIFYGQTRKVHVTYQLPSGLPRSSSDIRINPAIASFCVIGQGDDGGTTRVVIPGDYKVTITAGDGGTLQPQPGAGSAGTMTWSTGTLEQPYQFWACLSGTNEKGYATTTLTSPGGREIELEAWPEDAFWHAEVKADLNDILGKLESLVGEKLPGRGPIVLREVAGSELGNYAGYYDSTTGVIVMGEDLGQSGTVAHELSHAWFNDQAFFSTWMSEGLAEWSRISTVPDTCPEPGRYPDHAAAPDLADWQYAGPRATTTQIAVVDYQYEAACYIVSTLAAEAGPDHWRTVLDSLFKYQLAYRSGSLVLTHPQIPVTWRQWLDAVDELGLVPAGVANLDGAQNLLVQYGIATDRQALADRSRARARYHKLVTDLGDWTMPEAILRPMSEWGFGTAQRAMDQADAIRASVAQADAALPGIDASNGPIRMLFQTAKTVDDLRAAAAQAADQAKAAEAVAAAVARVAAPRDVLAQVGLAGADLDTPLGAATSAAKAADLAGAQAAVAQVNALLDGASQQGLIRIALALGVAIAILLLLVFVVLSIRRRRRRAAIVAVAAGPAEAAITVVTEAVPVEPSPGDAPPTEPPAEPNAQSGTPPSDDA